MRHEVTCMLVDPPALSTPTVLAFEEALVTASARCGFCLATIWEDRPSLVAGRTSKLEREVNLSVAEKMGVPIFRRISGGGTVYHDLGNLNLSVVLPLRLSVWDAHTLIASIIVRALLVLGVAGHIVNEGDVVVGSWKVSGSAVYVSRNATLVHATLLVDADLDLAYRLLHPLWARIASGVDPAKYRPANLVSIMPGLSISDARGAIQAVLASRWRLERRDTWPGLGAYVSELARIHECSQWRVLGRRPRFSRRAAVLSKWVCAGADLH
jgi:lipoyltransferase/lipoate-protein ligase